MAQPQIPGYAYGDPALPHSPISLADLEKLKETVLFTEDDARALRMAGEVLADQVDQILDVWYGFVGSHPFLAYYFSTPGGEPIPEYLDAVRKRFGQWIIDSCTRPYDQQWLDYQYEISQRHYRTKKGQTDHVNTVPIIHDRYITAFIVPLTLTIKPFLAKKGHSADEVEAMYNAWLKSVTLQATLWEYPFEKPGDF